MIPFVNPYHSLNYVGVFFAKGHCLSCILRTFHTVFSSIFQISFLLLRSFIHFLSQCFNGMREINFHYSACGYPVSQHCLLMMYLFSNIHFWHYLGQESGGWAYLGLSLGSIVLQWALGLFLCQYHTALITVVLWYSFKWFLQHGSFLRITLAIKGSPHTHTLFVTDSQLRASHVISICCTAKSHCSLFSFLIRQDLAIELKAGLKFIILFP